MEIQKPTVLFVTFLLVILIFIVALSDCTQLLVIQGQISIADTTGNYEGLVAYLFHENEMEEIESLRSKLSVYAQSVELELKDSLLRLNAKVNSRREESFSAFDEYIQKMNNLQTEYSQFIETRVRDVEYYAYSWHFRLYFRNRGNDKIKGLNFSLFFQDATVVQEMPLEIEIPDGLWKEYDNLYIDLSDRKFLHKKMVKRLLENRETFLKSLNVIVNSVDSEFDNSLKEAAEIVQYKQQSLDEALFELDEFPLYWRENLYRRVVIPNNRIIIKKMNEIAVKKMKVDKYGKFSISDIKPNTNYYIFVDGTSLSDGYEWYTQFMSVGNETVYVPYKQFLFTVSEPPEISTTLPPFIQMEYDRQNNNRQ